MLSDQFTADKLKSRSVQAEYSSTWTAFSSARPEATNGIGDDGAEHDKTKIDVDERMDGGPPTTLRKHLPGASEEMVADHFAQSTSLRWRG